MSAPTTESTHSIVAAMHGIVRMVERLAADHFDAARGYRAAFDALAARVERLEAAQQTPDRQG